MIQMTVADQPTNIQLPAEPLEREAHQREARPGWLRRDAITVAALAHAVVIAALLMRWPNPFAPVSQPQPIAVSLVMESPPPPPPPQSLQPPTPKPPPQPMHELESGPDQVTTAPPQAPAKGPEAAPKPKPESEDKDEKAAIAEPPKTKPSPATPRIVRPKEAARETVPKPERGSVDRAPGDIDRTGDPYLNRLWALIESHRTYPANAVGSLGLRLEGTATYLIEISSAGALVAMRLERSAGAPVLDDTARKMIEESAPFPPLPANFPRDGVVLSVTIHLFPEAS